MGLNARGVLVAVTLSAVMATAGACGSESASGGVAGAEGGANVDSAAESPAAERPTSIDCVDAEMPNPTSADVDIYYRLDETTSAGKTGRENAQFVPIVDAAREFANQIPTGGASKFVEAFCSNIPKDPPQGISDVDGTGWAQLKREAAVPGVVLYEHGQWNCKMLEQSYGTSQLEQNNAAIGSISPATKWAADFAQKAVDASGEHLCPQWKPK